MKIHYHDAGHMTKMAATPKYGIKHLKIFFPGTDFYETWYEASETQAHYILFK